METMEQMKARLKRQLAQNQPIDLEELKEVHEYSKLSASTKK